LSMAYALHKVGYQAKGIRLDSGDLAYLSKESRRLFKMISEKLKIDYFAKFQIVASNDINEQILLALNEQSHEIDAFGIGTNLVTCQSQPALGGVYKLVEINKLPRIKLSQEIEKLTLPAAKDAYRLYASGLPVIDLLVIHDRPAPKVGQKILCCHPFIENKRVYVTPSKVEPLFHLVWDGKINIGLPTINEIRQYAHDQILNMRPDHIRLLNPTPYKVSVDQELHDFIHKMWLLEAPIQTLI